MALPEGFEYLPGYSVNPEYVDDMVFEIDQNIKEVSALRYQTLIAGEQNSQAIFFLVPRFYDGIDLTDKLIRVVYLGPSGFTDINTVVCAAASEDQLRFAWVVPAGAVLTPGVLRFCVEFFGTDYSLKTRIVKVDVYESLSGPDSGQDPPDQVWYQEVQAMVADTLGTANSVLAMAMEYAQEAGQHAGDAEYWQGQVQETAESLQSSLNQIETNSTDIDGLEEDVDIINSRIDQMLVDYSGSESGEIADARIGHDGTSYASLGAAIRGQFNQLRLYVDSDGCVCQSES